MATKEHKLIIFYWNVHDSKKDEKCYNIKQDNKIRCVESFFMVLLCFLCFKVLHKNNVKSHS